MNVWLRIRVPGRAWVTPPRAQVSPQVDPFSPDNIVVISPGALNGTSAPTACRTEISTKSPLTGIFGTGNFGGYWGQALKNAGYDTVVRARARTVAAERIIQGHVGFIS